MHSENRVLLFQARNRVGLGHMNRLAAIAEAVRELDPTARLPFVIEGSSHGLLESYRLPYFPVPGHDYVFQSNAWENWDPRERRQVLKGMATKLLKLLAPNLLIFDCFPNLEMARAARKLGVPMVLVLRKMANWDLYLEKLDLAQSDVISWIKTIIVPHERDEMELPDRIKQRAAFVGAVVRKMRRDDRNSGAGRDEKLVVVTGGGGGYPGTVHFYNLCLRACALACQSDAAIRPILLAGPLFTDWLHLEIPETVRVLPFTPDPVELFRAASVVLCQGGYNTMNEVAALAVPAICVPSARTYDDQVERAAAFAARHAHFTVFEENSSDALAALLRKVLDRSPVPFVNPIQSNGAEAAARHLLALAQRQKT